MDDFEIKKRKNQEKGRNKIRSLTQKNKKENKRKKGKSTAVSHTNTTIATTRHSIFSRSLRKENGERFETVVWQNFFCLDNYASGTILERKRFCWAFSFLDPKKRRKKKQNKKKKGKSTAVSHTNTTIATTRHPLFCNFAAK